MSEMPAEKPSTGMPDWLRFPLVLGVVCSLSAAALALVYARTQARIVQAEGRKVTGAFVSVLGDAYSDEKSERFDLPSALGGWLLRDGEGELVARAAMVESPGSYNPSEPIVLMAVFDPELERVLGVRIVSSAETPGLGERIRDVQAPKSLLGMALGREPLRRVVMRSGGALVGKVEQREDGSIALTGPDGSSREVASDDVLEITDAPFPASFLDRFVQLSVEDARLKEDGGAVDAITGATISSRAVARGVWGALQSLRERKQ